jgi:succinate dehydrogenase / fumarate reductase cytochrome b subunit
MNTVRHFFRSSIGRKKLVGVTGLLLCGFLLTHMAGNLLIFGGADLYNQYAHALTSNKVFLYTAEAGLVVLFLVHLGLAMSLTIENRRARSAKYFVQPADDAAATIAARSMIHTGMLIFVFLIWHLITFKYGPWYETQLNGVMVRDLYRLMMEVFQSPGYVTMYFVAMIVVWFHLSHAVTSAFQSLGLRFSREGCLAKKVGTAFSILVALGFVSQPLYVFFNR